MAWLGKAPLMSGVVVRADTGIHVLAPDEYHADPCDTPSLSKSIIHLLCTSSPAHARAAHPRLNPLYARQEEQKFDLGTAAHALLLEGRDAVEVVHHGDWRTKDAKEQRDAARALGRIPLLVEHWDAVQAMVAATREQLEAVDATPGFFTDGKPEQTIVWEEDGVTCRALVDWLHDDLSAIDDYKTTSRSANPEGWTRSTLFSIGADVQAEFYTRGVRALTGITPTFRFVVQETQPPFALSVIALGPSVMELARKKVDYALSLWRSCLERDEWPAYGAQVCWASLPPWEESRWLEKEEREAAA